jgi:hypothetical protein
MGLEPLVFFFSFHLSILFTIDYAYGVHDITGGLRGAATTVATRTTHPDDGTTPPPVASGMFLIIHLFFFLITNNIFYIDSRESATATQ